MSELFVLSYVQTRPLLALRSSLPARVDLSLDLNRTKMPVSLDRAGLQLPDGQALSWNALEAISEDENSCYHIEENGGTRIQSFSDTLSRAYTLYPTRSAPTMLISGLPMHRIKGTDPRQDTLNKIRAAKPVGPVLDTAMGLGYTAIEAARSADHVTTIELDPTVVEICRLNPWSQDLFDNPKIQRRLGDSFDVIEEMEDAAFARVIHDPPTFSLAGHLYSADFYVELHRVLTRTGRLFHYIGDLESRQGAGVARGVRQRLKSAGFTRVIDKPRAFGVVAEK